MGKRTVQTLILIVDNEFGVLTRVTAQVRREGWNIKSLVVAETMNPAVSRLTISVECQDSTLPQVLERLGKLASVRAISAYSDETHFCREFMMATVACEGLSGAEDAARAFDARTTALPCGCLLVEFAGPPDSADLLLSALRPFGVKNVARSGAVTLEKPAKEELR